MDLILFAGRAHRPVVKVHNYLFSFQLHRNVSKCLLFKRLPCNIYKREEREFTMWAAELGDPHSNPSFKFLLNGVILFSVLKFLFVPRGSHQTHDLQYYLPFENINKGDWPFSGP